MQNDGVGTPTGWYVSATRGGSRYSAAVLNGATGRCETRTLIESAGLLVSRCALHSSRAYSSCRSGVHRRTCACSAHSARARTCSVRVRFLLAVAKLRCSRLWKELSEYATLPHSNHNVQHTNALLEGAVRARSAPHTAYTTSHSACAKNQVERAFWTEVSTVHATRCRHNPQQPNRAPLRCSRAAAHLGFCLSHTAVGNAAARLEASRSAIAACKGVRATAGMCGRCSAQPRRSCHPARRSHHSCSSSSRFSCVPPRAPRPRLPGAPQPSARTHDAHARACTHARVRTHTPAAGNSTDVDSSIRLGALAAL